MPLFEEGFAVFGAEGVFASGNDAGGDAKVGGHEYHVFGDAEGVGDAVKEAFLTEDGTHRWSAIEAALERRVVDDRRLLLADVTSGKIRTIEACEIHPADPFG